MNETPQHLSDAALGRKSDKLRSRLLGKKREARPLYACAQRKLGATREHCRYQY